MDTLDFLHFVITAEKGGWLPICSSLPDGSGWRQYWRAWPDDSDSTALLIQGLTDEGLNVFYSSHLFTERDSHKKFAMDTCTIQVDLDHAIPSSAPLPPSLLLNSSDHRFQAYWKLNQWIPAEELEKISRRVSWGIDKADHSGWSLGHMMRVPNTKNWKYNPPERVRVNSYNSNLYLPADFDAFPPLSVTEPLAILVDDSWIRQALQVPAGYNNANMFFESNKHRIREGLHVHYYNEAPDRSTALWSLMAECFRVGMQREEVFLIAYHSKNNKFRFLRYNGLQELAKDVIRAEREALSGASGIRGRIDTARRTNKTLADRRAAVADLARNQMMTHGKFIHARGGSLWYILDESGKPIPITHVSTELNVLLDKMFGLNAAEPEHLFVVNALINHTAGLSATGEMATLSHYTPESIDTDQPPTMLLHAGTKDILRITPTTIDTVINGYNDIVFLWNDYPVTPELTTEYTSDTQDTWFNAMFGMSMEHLADEGVNAEQAMAILRSWFIFILMRTAISSRPILAIFGQKGSGKSTLFKRVYAILYGPHKAVSSITTPQDFDYAMATDPLHVIDNVDTWERWLPDRIARAAGISEITKRKLYTDLDVVTLRLQAVLGVTAHNPKFGREDVVDRLLMITFERIENWHNETAIIKNVRDNRAKYWGQIARDVQRVLAEPPPTHVAQFRVQDFSEVGQRIANALGYPTAFYSAIQKIVDQQKGFVLDEDGMLVSIIEAYIQSTRYRNDVFQTPAKLWGIFDVLGGSNVGFSKQYGNSVKLGRKLWAMQDALKQRFLVEWKFDSNQKTRVWRFMPTTNTAPTLPQE